MRIISGYHKGKKIIAPDNLTLRPTTDFAKESLFNILNNYFNIEALSVLDLFAGTGNISYEFAARGATAITAVDNDAVCVNFIRKTALSLSFDNLTALHTDVVAFLEGNDQQFNVIFADPPYTWDRYDDSLTLIFTKNMLLPDGFLVIEHGNTVNFKSHPKFYQQRVYGKVNFSIFAENL
jgi:16S rRNA (guanine(966)-N(2))-methyltransferase RsmD